MRNGWRGLVLGARASGPRAAAGRQTGAGETPALPAAMRLLPQSGAPQGIAGNLDKENEATGVPVRFPGSP